MTLAELEVPHKFLPAFVIAANLAVMDAAEGIGSDLSLDYTDEGRRDDDEALVPMLEVLQDREAILRALDDGAAVPVPVLQRLATRAMDHLDGRIFELARIATEATRTELLTLRAAAETLGELSVWNARNLREREDDGLAQQTVTA